MAASRNRLGGVPCGRRRGDFRARSTAIRRAGGGGFRLPPALQVGAQRVEDGRRPAAIRGRRALCVRRWSARRAMEPFEQFGVAEPGQRVAEESALPAERLQEFRQRRGVGHVAAAACGDEELAPERRAALEEQDTRRPCSARARRRHHPRRTAAHDDEVVIGHLVHLDMDRLLLRFLFTVAYNGRRSNGRARNLLAD